MFIPPTNIKSRSFENAVQDVVDWFTGNFEDPVHSTPYNSAEGGYLYIWGGPYDARDIIESVFGGWLSEGVIEQAISELEHDSDLWVPNSARRLPPEDLGSTLEDETAGSLHAVMMERISAVESQLDAFEVRRPVGIGHNMPPDDIVDYHDVTEIHEACMALKEQPVHPADTTPAERALGKLKSVMDRLTAKAGQMTDVFLTEAAKAAGSEFGKWGGRAIVAGAAALLLDDLGKLIASAAAWLSRLGLGW